MERLKIVIRLYLNYLIFQIRIKLPSIGDNTATSSAADTTVMTPTTPTLSKSGRIIKPKKFVDESPDNSPAQGNDHAESKIKVILNLLN
jgi:hypothetical protein